MSAVRKHLGSSVYYFQCVGLAINGNLEHVRMDVLSIITEQSYKLYVGFPVLEWVEFGAVAFRERLTERNAHHCSVCQVIRLWRWTSREPVKCRHFNVLVRDFDSESVIHPLYYCEVGLTIHSPVWCVTKKNKHFLGSTHVASR